MVLHPRGLALVQPIGNIPRQQRPDLVVVAGMKGNDTAHGGYSQSDRLPASARRRWRLAWNMRVFTVSTGQSMISDISR